MGPEGTGQESARPCAVTRVPVVLPVVGLLVAGLIATLAGAWAARTSELNAAHAGLDRRSDLAVTQVGAELRRFEDTVTAVAASLTAQSDLTAEEFRVVTQPILDARLAGVSGVSFAVAATDSQVPGAEAYWRAHGATGLTVQDSLPGIRHMFQVFVRSLDGRPAVPGRDLATTSQIAWTLRAAERRGRVAVSPTYVLLKDRQLPPERQQLSFVMAAPVAARDARPAGWVLLSLRAGDLLRGTLQDVASDRALVVLRDGVEDGARVVARAGAGEPDPTGHVHRVRVPVADDEWLLDIRGTRTAARDDAAGGYLTWSILGGGGAVTLLLGLILYLSLTQRRRALARVDEATADLRRAEEAARRQAGLLHAVMDSIGDGVGVVDRTGAFLLHNPAAHRLLGTALDNDAPGEWQEHYGLYRPDGETPFPTEELPLVRALAGESTEQVEMIVRRGDGPDTPLSVSARPLDEAAGVAGAVAVFHDISAQQEAAAKLRAAALELQRSNRDLEQFAYVASHDLQEPLRKVVGFCQLLQRRYAGRLDERADEYLAFAVDGATRMQRLIQDLLAFARMGQAATTVTEVDLDRCFEAALRNLEDALAEAGAEVTAGPLPRLVGQPTLLTQLLQNLVANAVKFRAEGRPPRVHVAARRLGDVWELTCTDNGIGIDPEHAEKVFVVFQRLHSREQYEGTGIGLATCRKIVEYHGGTIRVEPGEGCGTVVRWTLAAVAPAAAASAPPAQRVPDAPMAATSSR